MPPIVYMKSLIGKIVFSGATFIAFAFVLISGHGLFCYFTPTALLCSKATGSLFRSTELLLAVVSTLLFLRWYYFASTQGAHELRNRIARTIYLLAFFPLIIWLSLFAIFGHH